MLRVAGRDAPLSLDALQGALLVDKKNVSGDHSSAARCVLLAAVGRVALAGGESYTHAVRTLGRTSDCVDAVLLLL